jgi:hypothetical protein
MSTVEAPAASNSVPPVNAAHDGAAPAQSRQADSAASVPAQHAPEEAGAQATSALQDPDRPTDEAILSYENQIRCCIPQLDPSMARTCQDDVVGGHQLLQLT